MKTGKKLSVTILVLLLGTLMITPFFVYGLGREETPAAGLGTIAGEAQLPEDIAAEDIEVLIYDAESYIEEKPETAVFAAGLDEDGSFKAAELPAGSYRLEFYGNKEDSFELGPVSEDAQYKVEHVEAKEFFAYVEVELEAEQEYALELALQMAASDDDEPEAAATDEADGKEESSSEEATEEVSDEQPEAASEREEAEESEEDDAAEEVQHQIDARPWEFDEETLPTIKELTQLDLESAAATVEMDRKSLFQPAAGAIVGTDWTYDVYYVGEDDKYHTDKTDDFSLRYQMEFHTSTSLESGEVEIRIPAVLLTDRSGSPLTPDEIAVPAGTPESPVASNTSPFNYYVDEQSDELVFFNYKGISAGTNAAFQVLYKNIKIMQIKDQSAWSLEAVVTVDQTAGGGTKEEQTAQALTGTVDSEVILSKVSKIPYNYTGDSYTPGLYTQTQIEKYISGSLPDQYADHFDEYVYVVWRVSVTGSATQPWNMRIKETPGNGGEVVGYGSGVSSTPWSEDNDYITGMEANTSKNISQSFYVVTAYPATVSDGDIVTNEVDIILEPYDGTDPDQSGSDTAEWSYKDYVWEYEGDMVGIRKSAASSASKGWLEVYRAAASDGEDLEVSPYSTTSTVNGYEMTHETVTGSTLGSSLDGKSYQVTTVDDVLYASSSDNASDLKMLGEDDYYFSSVKIKQTDYGYDPWEDTYAAPEDAGDLKIYAWYAGGTDWEPVTTIPWSDWSGTGTNKSASYTFTDEQIGKQPWRVMAVHETVNYKTICSLDVTVNIRHDSPVLEELAGSGKDPDSVTIQNISGVMTEELKDGALVAYKHGTETTNYSQYPTDLADITTDLYDVILQRDSAQVNVSRLLEAAGSAKTATASNDVANGRVQVKYTLTAYDGYELYGQDAIRHLVSAGMDSPGRNEVVFYDLLPYGVQFDPSVAITAGRTTGISTSVASSWDTSQAKVTVDSASDVTHNYNGTGRTLIAFHISYEGAEPAFYSNGMWMEGWGISFGAYYEWKNLDIVAKTPNISAFMADEGDDTPLPGAEYKNDGTFPQVAGQPDLYEDFGSDIGGLGTGRDVLYAWSAAESNVVMSATSNIEKLVRADADGYSAFEQETTAAYNAGYTYELTISNAVGTLEDIVIFDRLENAAKDRGSVTGERDFDSTWWHGTYVGIQTRVLDELGIDYVIYYNADRDAAVPDMGSAETPADILTTANGWYKEADWNLPLSDVRAIAVDLTDFQLQAMESLSLQIQMQAPATDPGAKYAYNNPSWYAKEVGTTTAELTEGDSVRVELGEGNNIEVEKRFDGEIPETVAATQFAFTAYREDEKGTLTRWANREYDLYQWKEEAQDWEKAAGLYATDSNGVFYLSGGEKALFQDIPAAGSIVVREEENFYWRVEESEESISDGRRLVFTNRYQPVLYAQKSALYAPEEVDLMDYWFEFQLLADGEPLANTEFWYVDQARTDGGAANKVTSKGMEGVGQTDGEGKFMIQDGDIIALPMPEPGGVYTLREVSGADAGEDWFCLEDTITGTIPVFGTSVTIKNYYRWKDLYLTKTITSQDAADCTEAFTFRVTDEEGNPVTGNTWVLLRDGAEADSGTLGPDGEFTSACGGGVIRIEGLEAGKTYLIEETDSGTLYEALNGGLVEVTMPVYGASASAEITNDYLKRSLSVTKLVVYDESDTAATAEVKTREFEMTAEINGVPLANTQYKIYENNKLVGTGTTDSDGKFTLKNGQTAVFEEVGEKGQSYRIEETPDDDYPQIFPTGDASHEGILSQQTTAVTFINGDSDGMLMLRKEYVGEDADAEAFLTAYQNDPTLWTDAAVNFTLEVTPENGQTYIWPTTNTNVTVVDNLTGSSETVTWRRESSITVEPWKTIYVEDLNETDSYRLYESSTDKHRIIQWPEDSESWYEISQETPESDRALTGVVGESPLAVIVNSIRSLDTDGSRIHKEMTADSDEVPTGAELVWRLEEYDGSVWNPKAGITYFIMDDQGVVSDRVLTTGTDGLITLQKTDAGYPAVQFIDAEVKINYYEGMGDGDLRLVEVLAESDSEWGYLSGYVNDSGVVGLDIGSDEAIGFVNSNIVITAEIEKQMEDSDGATFTFILEQVVAASASPVTDESQILETEVRGGIFYTIHDSETNELVGEGRTTAKGEIIITSGQYVRLQLPNHTLWTVREQVTLPYSLELMSGEDADELTKLDDNLMLLQVSETAPYYEPITLTRTMVANGVTDIDGNMVVLNSGDVIVPDKIIYEGEIRVITAIGEGTSTTGVFYTYRTAITSVQLPDTLTRVGDYAFYQCTNIVAVDMPGVEEIGIHAFSGGNTSNMMKIEEIAMPKVKTIDNYAFRYCISLEELNLPETANLGDYAFANCTGIEEIKAPKLKEAGAYAFAYCSALTEVNLPEAISLGDYAFVTSTTYGSSLIVVNLPKAVSLGRNAFEYHTSLLEIDLPEVEEIGQSAFRYCSSLEEADLPNLTQLETYVFYSCGGLRKVNLPEVLSVGTGAFTGTGGVSSLTEVNLPKAESIGQTAFSGCVSLTKIDLPQVVTIGNGGFRNCTSLTEVNLPKVESIGTYAFSLASTDEDNLDKVYMPEIESIDTNAFEYRTNLTEIEMSKVRNIEAYAFRYCNSLEKVNIPEVETIGASAFYQCYELELEEVQLLKVESIGASAFNQCTSLGEVYIPKVKIIEASAFRYCTSLEEIYLPEVETIGDYAFTGSDSDSMNLKRAIMPETTEIGRSAFQYCTSLEEVDISKVKTIDDYAFLCCYELEEVYMPEVETIGNSAFAGASTTSSMKLSDVYMPKVETIGTGTFRYNEAMEIIYIPATTTSIGGSVVFGSCTALTDIYIDNSPDAIAGSPWGATSATITWNTPYPVY